MEEKGGKLLVIFLASPLVSQCSKLSVDPVTGVSSHPPSGMDEMSGVKPSFRETLEGALVTATPLASSPQSSPPSCFCQG